jgi:ADP-heptose:LPS heptosyltransferase
MIKRIARSVRRMYFCVTDRLVSIFIDKAPVGSEGGRILVVRNDGLGDVILSLPAVRSLKLRYPASEVTLLVNDSYAGLLRNCSYIDRVITDPKQINERYDVAIALTPGSRANAILAETGARKRVGFGGCGGARYLTDVYWDDRDKRPRHEAITCGELMALAGARDFDPTIVLPLEPVVLREAAVFLDRNNIESGKYLVMHPGASRDYLRWPPERFAQLARMIHGRYSLPTILSFGPDESVLKEVVASRIAAPNICCQFESVKKMAGIYASALMYIGNVTGPMHLASALRKPVVAITAMFGNLDDMRYWGPWTVPFDVVMPAGNFKGGHPSDCDFGRDIREINEAQVLDKFELLYEKIEHGYS